jgi:hypothetical protein
MSFGKKYFLSRRHDCTDYIAWFGNKHTKQLKLQMNNITVSLHVGDGENPLPSFLLKLETLHSELQALLAHPIGQHCNRRVWLNLEAQNVQHFTGHFAWGYADDLFYYTLADCQRAIRGQYNYTTRYGTTVLKAELKILKRVANYIASAITDFKKLEEKHV